MAGRDHDSELAQSGRQRAVEAHVIAHMEEQKAEAGAARIGVERPAVERAVARRRLEVNRHLLLLWRQLVEMKLGESF